MMKQLEMGMGLKKGRRKKGRNQKRQKGCLQVILIEEYSINITQYFLINVDEF